MRSIRIVLIIFKEVELCMVDLFRRAVRTVQDHIEELPAAVIADAVVRLLPGAIGDEQSALSDSFQDGLIEAPVYTRPEVFNGWHVPEILLSGHAAKIAEWKMQQSLERTRRLRPHLLDPDNNDK
jgi:tRNA (guanine-N1)-methyltransferase